jgi:uncharacterized phiE125 gp8 family phage protein
MEVKITSAVSEANEPLLKVVGSGLEKYIFRYLNYPESGGNASEVAMIKKFAIAAREMTEKYLNKSLAEQTLVVVYDADHVKKQNYKVELPYCPLSSIPSVKILMQDSANDITLTAGSDYYLYGTNYPEIEFAVVTSTGTTKPKGYQITYVAGYGAANCQTIPDAITLVLAELCAKWYSNRGVGENILDYETQKKLNAYKGTLWI